MDLTKKKTVKKENKVEICEKLCWIFLDNPVAQFSDLYAISTEWARLGGKIWKSEFAAGFLWVLEREKRENPKTVGRKLGAHNESAH